MVITETRRGRDTTKNQLAANEREFFWGVVKKKTFGDNTEARRKMKSQGKSASPGRHGLAGSRRTGGKAIHFPRVKGRVVENVEFSTTREGHTVSLQFQDGLELNLDIEPGLSLTASLIQWKSGRGRVVRKWPPVRSA